MKRFIIQISTFSAVVIILFLLLLSFADGHTDPFYTRFTTSRQANLILGTSRAAQGLQPSIFSSLLNKNFYNYSFSNSHSPFGPVYLNSIKKKLDKSTKDGIFIITVSPWSISSKTINPNDTLNFRELSLCLNNTPITNLKPNLFYLLHNLNGRYYKIISGEKSMYLHNDGWLEVKFQWIQH